MYTQSRESSLHSREKRDETSTGEPSTSRHQAFQKTKKKKSKKSKGDKKTGKTVDTATESPMSIEDDNQAEKCDSPKKRKGFAYYPLLTYKRELDKTFYFKYFIPYSHDYRRLRMKEDCQCPHSEPMTLVVSGMTQTSSTSLKRQMTFQLVKKQPSRKSMIST